MSYISENLKQLRKTNGLTQDELANKLGIKRSLVGAYEEGRAEPPVQNLKNISKVFGVSIDDFVSKRLGRSSSVIHPLTGLPTEPDRGLENLNFKVLAITVNEEEEENIEYIPQKAAAGYLNGFSDPEYLREMPKFHLPNLPRGTYRAFEVSGDSMLPIMPGAVVIGKYLPELQYLKNGSPCVLLTKNDGVVFKRVFPEGAGKLKLVSDNQQYQPYLISHSDVLELWEVVMFIGKEWPSTPPPEQNHAEIMTSLESLRKEVMSLRS